MKISRIAIAVAFFILGVAFIAPDYFPNAGLEWARYTAAAILLSPIAALNVLIARAAWMGVRERARDRKVVREVPASNGIQVLGTFLRDDPNTFYERKYDIVRRIHGDDNASRLTREQIEAEYDRYDRAETAASEDRCQSCDPVHTPAEFLVEAWDDRRGEDSYIGEWLLCPRHAEAKTTSVRRTGANATAEPMLQAHVDEFTADRYGEGGAR